MKRLSTIALGLAALWVAGCSAGSGSSGGPSILGVPGPTPPPFNGIQCQLLTGAPILEVPAPGATGVPVTLGSLQIYLGSAQSLSFATSTGTSVPVGPLVAATPPPGWTGLPSWFTASLSQLSPATTYVVTANVYQACFGYSSHFNIGSFTTAP